MIGPAKRRAGALALAFCVAASLPGPPAAAALSAADRADIARVEGYLNTVRSVRSAFVQISNSGQVAEGRLYLERPSRLRLDYKPPATLQVYADGYWLAYVDTELEEVTHVPLSSTLAGLLVRKSVRLSGDVTVTKVERGAQTLRLHLVQTEEPEAGTLVLSLRDEPLSLSHWTVIDAQGAKTRVSLIGPEFNVRIARSVFQFDASRFERDGYQ